jgi:hypothetical protein
LVAAAGLGDHHHPIGVLDAPRPYVRRRLVSVGSGTRLWQVSRESFPKQFWPLLPDRSMIEETAWRPIGPGVAQPLVVCNQDYRILSTRYQWSASHGRTSRSAVDPPSVGAGRALRFIYSGY